MRALGIDVGEDSIKIAEVIQSKKNIFIQSVFEKKLSPLVSPQDREIEAIEFVRSISNRLDTSTARVIMALKQDKITVRKKQFPFSDRLKILKSLSFEMEEDIPFDPDLCIFEAKTILFEGLSAHVLAAAAPKSHIEKVLNLARDFAIEPYSLSLDGLACANLIEDWESAPPQYATATGPLSYNPEEPASGHESLKASITVTLNMGHKRTMLLAQIDGRLVFVRTLYWGADQLIQEIIKKFQVPYAEAQKILKTNASLFLTKTGQSFEAVNLASALELGLQDLIRDLQMSFLEIQSEFHGEIKSLQFTGGPSLLPNLAVFLTQSLEVACNPVSLIDSYIQNDQIQLNNLSLDQVRSRFSTAVGLALEAFKKPKNPALQFMRAEFASDNNKFKTYWAQWGTLTQLGLATLIIIFTWGFFRESLTLNLAQLGEEALVKHAKSVARLPKKQANEKGVKKFISENKKKSQEIKLLNKVVHMNSALEILNKISESAPAKDQSQIDLAEIEIKDDLVILSGYANTPREVTLLKQRLASVAVDQKVTDHNLSQPQSSGLAPLPPLPNRVSFSLQLKTDRGLAK